ncbi:MAG: DUF1289 domain-containing protein [Proteobacteria bacterium]|nr:MAG: DUF1289 domain-containing protein [Pseudomonadota bacterium]
MSSIESPCVDICQLREGQDLCRGCYRTIDEIVRWSTMTPIERRRIMNDLSARKSASALDGDQ